RETLGALLSGRNAASSVALQTASGYLSAAPLWISGLAVFWLSRISRWLSIQGLTAFSLLAYSLFAALTTGARSWTLPLLASVVVVWYVRRGRRPSLLTAGIAIGAVLVLGVSVPRDYRSTSDRQTGLGELVISTATHPTDAL